MTDDEGDCLPDRISVRAVPPNDDTGDFDWESGSMAVFYHSRQEPISSNCVEEHVYRNDNGLRYNLRSDQDIQCPESITIEATGDDIDGWNLNVVDQLEFTESSSVDGTFYCSYEVPNFAVRLNKCPGRLDGQTTVLVEVTYDDYAFETGWSINSKDGNVLVSSPPYSMFQNGTTIERVFMDPGEYIFNIIDLAGDGSCCEFGEGSWQLLAELDGDDQVLLNGDGNYTFGVVATFVVPDTTKGGPMTCQDSDSETFLVDDSVGEKACSWLADNLDRFDFLCRFTDIAFACPRTCDICDELQ